MSFCYAELIDKDIMGNKNIYVYVDTKIGVSDNAGANLSDLQLDWVRRYGIIKCTILANKICIAYAGNNLNNAAKLFCALRDKGSFELEDVSDMALSVHKSTDNKDDIEFIIAYYDDESFHLDCIKDGVLERDVPNCHIGSRTAFEKFQRERIRLLSGNDGIQKYTDKVFHDTVDGCKDDSVGGFSIRVAYFHNSNRFAFAERMEVCSFRKVTVNAGESIPFLTSNEDGGYVCTVSSDSIEECLLKFEQTDMALLYSRKYRLNEEECRNDNLFGLMLPLKLRIKGDNGELWK